MIPKRNHIGSCFITSNDGGIYVQYKWIIDQCSDIQELFLIFLDIISDSDSCYNILL